MTIITNLDYTDIELDKAYLYHLKHIIAFYEYLGTDTPEYLRVLNEYSELLARIAVAELISE